MPKVIERVRTFALDDEVARVRGVVPGFRRYLSILASPLPAARVGDLVSMRLHQSSHYGEARIIDVKEIGGRLDDSHYTLLLVCILDEEGNENDV